jgi:site-specific recombinase XerC
VATANKQLSALRGVLKECWRLELVSAQDYQRAVDVENFSEHKPPAGRHVESGEITALIRVCRVDPGPAGARDGALLGVSFAAGLRVSELVGITLEDLNRETGELVVRGKGRKTRTSYIESGALAAVSDWLRFRHLDAGPLFCPVR